MPKRKTAPKTVSVADIYNQVASRANTNGVKINVAETKRVLACFFDVLEDLPPRDAFDVVAKGLKLAGKRRR